MNENIVAVIAPDRNLVVSPTVNVVAVTSNDKQILVAPEEKVLSVSAPGPPGPQGGTGPPAGAAIVYDQIIPAASWPIAHGLNRPVGVVIRLANGEIVYTQVDQSDLNTVVVIFPTPMAGKALVI